MSCYRLEPARLDENWDRFIEASPNGTIFSSSAYLNAFGHPCDAYYCLKREEVRAAVAVVSAEAGNSTVLHDLVVYNGLIHAAPKRNQNKSQNLSEQFATTEFVAQALAERYREVHFQLAPSVADIRAFLWFRYGEDLPGYVPDVRYTSHLDISGLRGIGDGTEPPLFRDMSAARRQEIRYAQRKGVVAEECFEPDRFVHFYSLTMGRQGIAVEAAVLDDLRRILQSLGERGLGRMFVSSTADGRPGSMAFFGLDSKRAYFLFGANDPELRNTHVGSAVLWEAFLALAGQGVNQVDLEGVNSPRRGWFKLSFGGDLIPYYYLFKPADR